MIETATDKISKSDNCNRIHPTNLSLSLSATRQSVSGDREGDSTGGTPQYSRWSVSVLHCLGPTSDTGEPPNTSGTLQTFYTAI